MTASPEYGSLVSATRGIGLVCTRFNVLPLRETTGISDDALACYDIVIVDARLAGSHSEGPDTIGVTECDYPEACQHSDASVCTLGLFHQSTDSLEYILLVDPELSRLLEIVGEYVEEKLGI